MAKKKRIRICPVAGCCAPLEGKRLMCFDHWSSLPFVLQKDIRETWKRDGLAKALPILDGAVSLLGRRAAAAEAARAGE